MKVYLDAAYAWYYPALALFLLGLLRLRSVRRAIPFWFLAGVLAVYTIPGPRALSRHYLIAHAFIAAAAAASVAAMGSGLRSADGDPDDPGAAVDAASEPPDETGGPGDQAGVLTS
jgi:hypothetical protein